MMADNETLVSWRFDMDNVFTITCANRCLLGCALWTKTAPSWPNLRDFQDHFVSFGASKTTPLKSSKFIVNNRVLGT